LDPFYNENFWNGDDALAVDTLIAETNAGSLRWMYSLDQMPIPYSNFAKADLDAYILPDEGYTSKEALARTERQKEVEAAVNVMLGIEEKKLTPEEFVQKAAEVYEAAQEEYEETKMILNAPPASDFVPGLDDAEAIDATSPVTLFVESDKALAHTAEVYGKYVNATEEEFQEARETNRMEVNA
jgi:hypothetical protein